MSEREWTVAQIVGVMRHLAWERPELVGGALWAVCKSDKLSGLCRKAEPTPQAIADLAVSSRMARALIHASRRGWQLLRVAPAGRREPLRERLERRVEQIEELMASPTVPEDARPGMERVCRGAVELATSTIRMQEAEAEMTEGLAELVATGYVSMEVVLAALAKPEDVS